MTPAEVLQEFYADWHMWATHGAGPHAVFRKDLALCESLLHWNRKRRAGGVFSHRFDVLDNLQMDLFMRDGLSLVYPFNRDRSHFLLEALTGKCHLNTRRLAWAAEHAQGITT
jgi:hypothetical protein